MNKISPKEEFYWNKLDNTAKVYPAISDNNTTNVFRLSVKLKNKIIPDNLFKAVDNTLKILPAFNVKLRRGLFWYYFDTNFSKPIITEDKTFPCNTIDRFRENGFLFKVTYFNNKINLEVFHALSDGNGALIFLNCIICEYLKLIYPNSQKLKNININDTSLSQLALEENSFLSTAIKNNENNNYPIKAPIPKQSYKISGLKLSTTELKAMHIILNINEINELSKKSNVTLTVYLTSLLILSIYEESWKYSNRKYPISICVPVNLRSLFKSSTMRNFFSFVNITVDFNKREYTFNELLSIVSKQLKEKTTKENMLKNIMININAEKAFALRIIPLFLKKIGIKLLAIKTEKGNTSTLSNLGKIKVPKELLEYIERYDVLINTTTHQTVKLGVACINDCLSLTFSSSIEETDIQRFFCRFLSDRGININLITN